MLAVFERLTEQQFVHEPRYCQKCRLLAYPAEGNIVLHCRLHHHDADQEAVEINGHDFLVNELAAFATKVLGLPAVSG